MGTQEQIPARGLPAIDGLPCWRLPVTKARYAIRSQRYEYYPNAVLTDASEAGDDVITSSFCTACPTDGSIFTRQASRSSQARLLEVPGQEQPGRGGYRSQPPERTISQEGGPGP